VERQAASFDSFTSSDQRGAGLGLALVKNFVDLHGGSVGIKSVPGGGTEVVCWLPVKAVVTRQPDWDVTPARASA
jgi:signal transduction histidine kinase